VYLYGQAVVLTPVPEPGWSFYGWEGMCDDPQAPLCTVTMDADKSVTAIFIPDEYTLEVTTEGSGAVSRDLPGPYNYGDVVTLTAIPDTGWVFAGWSGDVTGTDNPLTLTISGDMNVTATFIPPEYELTILLYGNGVVDANPDKPVYAYGEVVELTAVADPGWYFTGWSGDLTGKENPISLTITGDMEVIANFEEGVLIPKNLITNAAAVDSLGEPLAGLAGWTASGSAPAFAAAALRVDGRPT